MEPPAREAWAIYEQAFRGLLWRVRARRLQLGVDLLQRKAEGCIADGTPPPVALQQVYDRARGQVIRQLVRRRAAARRSCGGTARAPASDRRLEQIRRLLDAGTPQVPIAGCPDFHCDAALGGLARWIRGAGYDAAWWPGIEDDRLVEKVLGTTAILLTTDRRLMHRGVIQWGAVPALLIPISMKKREQFAFVGSELNLKRKEPRCMRCGGRLQRVAKEAIRERIPPRTYPWRDDYFLCERCDKLFWKGTHWQRIEPELAKLQGEC